MTSVDLEGIRERMMATFPHGLPYPAGRLIHEDAPALVAEVERLRAENARLRTLAIGVVSRTMGRHTETRRHGQQSRYTLDYESWYGTPEEAITAHLAQASP